MTSNHVPADLPDECYGRHVRADMRASIMCKSAKVEMHKMKASNELCLKIFAMNPIVTVLLTCRLEGLYLSGSALLSAFVDFEPNDFDVFFADRQFEKVFTILDGIGATYKTTKEYENLSFCGSSYKVELGAFSIDLVRCTDPLNTISMADLSSLKIAFDGKDMYFAEGWDPVHCRSLVEETSTLVYQFPQTFRHSEWREPTSDPEEIARDRALRRVVKYQQRGLHVYNINGTRIPYYALIQNVPEDEMRRAIAIMRVELGQCTTGQVHEVDALLGPLAQVQL